MSDPILLPSNQPADRFYRGGPRIAAFRGETGHGDRVPEDWVASTTTVRGHSELGRTRLPGGELLADAVATNPTEWLGPQHVSAYGADARLLVKLLDAGQRLPVHAHPDADFARAHVGALHGKAEAWYILTPGEVWLGLTRDVSAEELSDLVERQDVEGMLDLMHRVPVEPHQTVYVPPGVLHAIGEGILLAELQEPEDLSILLEWRDFELDGRADGHLGLGFETALTAVETRGRTASEVAGLVGDARLVDSSNGFFRLERLHGTVDTTLEAGFAVMIVLEGEFAIEAGSGALLEAVAGTTTLVPYGAGELTVRGRGTALVARPPRA